LQASHAYCRSSICVRDGLYMNHYQKGMAILPDFGQPYLRNNDVILRLIRKGTTYFFQMSADGSIFFAVGEHVSTINPIQVGLVAGQNIEGVIIPALFDYFEITSPQQ